MWTWVMETPKEAERTLTDVLAPLLNRDATELRGQGNPWTRLEPA
jgi:hypothetical protein